LRVLALACAPPPSPASSAMGAKPCTCTSSSDPLEANGAADATPASDEAIANMSKEPLSSADMDVVESTWKSVAALGAEKVGTLLFKNIFTIAPGALDLYSFKKEPHIKTYETPGIKAHGAKVVNTLGTAIDSIWDLSKVVPALQELGIRHIGYGVTPAHYGVVGKALMQTLEAGLGSAFTRSARVAWSKVWHIVSTTMLEAAAGAGPLTGADIKLVKDSWASAAALGAETVGILLFKNIFTIAPAALDLFSFKDEKDVYNSPKLKAHAIGVVNTVGVAVSKLEALGEVVPVLQELGRNHVRYGVKAAHYEVVGKALLETLRGGLGSAFKPEVEVAWTKVFKIVSDTMIGDNYK